MHDLASIRSALLRYYDAHARDLPWRRTRDAYAIWVSEVMLQQTRVETVLAYYDRFLERFPTAEALAAASEDAVLASWSGLGYYRRARLLHAGVRDVVARYGGVVPRDPQLLRALPGVGRYTAGAIGSIAFELPEPLVDGNVARVFARLFAIDTPPERADTQARLWQLAEQLVHGERPGALNQALMELGARVCKKVAPSCETCPVAQACQARASGRVAELPPVRKRALPKPVALVALAAFDRRGERLLLVRGEEQLFGGLWNLPAREGRGRKVAEALCETVGAREPKRAAKLTHVLTHRRLSVEVYTARAPIAARGDLVRLQPRAALHELGVSRLTYKALEALEGPDVAGQPESG
ncbi:MAG TPA: A/G-specific adenine glycosylase [Polyangiales bacterium]|nr:A/G-specific adenine glycosylase [Polyangiales bacterium]